MRLKRNTSIKPFIIIALMSVVAVVLTATGAAYYLFGDVFAEREVIEIPDLVGKRADNIGDLSSIYIEREPVFSDAVAEGRVISQFPRGGAKRKLADGEKCTVKLTVSLGKELKTVPQLKNYKYTDAAAVLRSLGAKIKIVSVYDDKIEGDRVLRTLPESGESIEIGDTVTLFVSRNHIHAPISVRSFVGLPLEEATLEILSDGLLLGNITREYSDTVAEGKVISQSIGEGSTVLYGCRIDIVVSEGKKTEALHPFRGQYKKENGEINGID